MSDSSPVTRTRQDAWQASMNGTTETRVSFGTSALGHHYQMEVSRLGADPENPGWSRPFRNAEQAERVADIRSSIALGDHLPSARQEASQRMAQSRPNAALPEAAKVAQALSSAGDFRRAATSEIYSVPAWKKTRDGLLNTARRQLEQARAINQAGQQPSRPVSRVKAAEPIGRPAPVVVITQAMRDASRRVASAAPAAASSAVQRHAQAARPSRASL